ncbi:MAG: hypothetical protein JW764_04590 [Chlorobiaceae bacterium]|nr:hypothetical protein [Chlorobiaceae bacterium]
MLRKVPAWVWMVVAVLAGGYVLQSAANGWKRDEVRELADSWDKPKPKPEAAAAEPEKVDIAWSYSSFEDEMSSKNIGIASIQSVNTVNFGFPYEGEQRALLQLRQHPRYGKDVMLVLERGHFHIKYGGTPVLVRFDDGEAMSFTAFEPDDNDTEIIFIQGYKRFVDKLKGATVVKIEAPFYQEGTRVFEFAVSEFDDNW